MRFAAMMGHPNIVTVYTTGACDGAPFMVMEYLRGHDLERAQPDGGAARVAAIGRDVCAALAYAHGQGVIHRDIKPGNLFLCDTGQVKVTDFGIARAASGTTLSVAGSIVGTFAYMPPEQWRGAAPAFSNDVWAAGCVLYRLISGRPPRVFPDAAGYATAALRGDPVPGLREVSGAPAWLAGPGRRRDRGGTGAAGRGVARRAAVLRLTAVHGQRHGRHVRPGGKRRRDDAGRVPRHLQAGVRDGFRARACPVGCPLRHAHGQRDRPCDVKCAGLNRAGPGTRTQRGGHGLRRGAAEAGR
jgi:serine/threonine protein kinase